MSFRKSIPSPRGVLAWLRLPALVLAILQLPAQGAEPSGAELIEAFLADQNVSSEMAFVRMQFLQDGSRVDERRLLMLYQKNDDGSADYLVRMVRPKDVEGVTILATVDPDDGMEQSIFLPSIDQTRPLTGEAQFSPFLGSDFAYADLVQEIPGTQRYERLADDYAQGMLCHVVRATPVGGDSAYGSRKLFLARGTNDLQRIEYFDGDGKLLKMLDCFDYESPEIHGTTIRPHRAVMSNPSKGTSTVFTVIVGRVGEKISPTVFETESVENWTSDEVDDFMFQLSLNVTGSAD